MEFLPTLRRTIHIHTNCSTEVRAPSILQYIAYCIIVLDVNAPQPSLIPEQ